jgi:hypothetical protein
LNAAALIRVGLFCTGWLVVACDAGKSSQGGPDDDSTSSGSTGATGSTTSTSGGLDAGSEPEAGPAIIGGYFVQGNQIFRESDGELHRFRGVARPSLEWSRVGEGLSLDDYRRIAAWGANVVRIALNQAFWL